MKKVVIAVIIFFAGFVIFEITRTDYNQMANPAAVQTSTPTDSTSTASSTPTTSIGDTIRLVTTDTDTTAIAPYAWNFDELIKLTRADDTVGIKKMAKDGEILVIKSVTQAKVIDMSYMKELGEIAFREEVKVLWGQLLDY